MKLILPWHYHEQQGQALWKGVLETSLRDTYVMYPYHESHKNRALGSPECRPIQYLITMRIPIQILRTKVHVESGREYLPHGNLMPLILRTNLLSKPNGNPIAIIALSILEVGLNLSWEVLCLVWKDYYVDWFSSAAVRRGVHIANLIPGPRPRTGFGGGDLKHCPLLWWYAVGTD